MDVRKHERELARMQSERLHLLLQPRLTQDLGCFGRVILLPIVLGCQPTEQLGASPHALAMKIRVVAQ